MKNFLQVIKLFLVLLIVSSFSTSFSFAQKRVFTLSYDPHYAPFTHKTKDEEAHGLLVDIWRLWAETNGYKLKFVDGVSWNNALQMAKLGEVDFFIGTQAYEAWMKSSKPFYIANTAFFTNKKNRGKFLPDMPMRVGIIGHDYEYAIEENYINASVKIYKSYKDAIAALKKEEVDYVYDDKLALHQYIINQEETSITKVLEPHIVEEKSFIQAISNRQSSIDIFNKGLDKLDYNELLKIEKKWILASADRYYENQIAKEIVLNEYEKAFIREKVFKVSVSKDWMPITFQGDDKKPAGVAFDIWKDIVQKLHLNVEYIFNDTYAQQIEAIKNKEADIIFSSAITPDMLKHVLFSNKYLSSPLSIATKKDENFIEDLLELESKSVAVIKDSTPSKMLKRTNIPIKLVPVKNIYSGLKLVEEGEVYAFVDIKPTLLYTIKKFGFDDLKITGNAGAKYDMRIMVRDDYGILIPVLNKALHTISQNKIEGIVDEWLHKGDDMASKKNRVFSYMLLGTAFIISLLSILYYVTRQINKKLTLSVAQKTSEINRLSQVVEQSNVSVVMTDLEGVIIYVNDYATKTTGYSKKELIGQNPRVLKSGYQPIEFYTDLWQTILSGKTWTGEFSNKTKSGKIFYESAVLTPIFDEKGSIQFLAAIKENITEKVESRKKLEIAQKEAIEANRAKSNFLANMSHEIRTPMNAIIGMTYLAQQTKLSPQQKNYMQKVEIAAKNLLGIINDILDFSKIEAGKLKLEKHRFNIEEILQNILNLFSFEAEKKGLELLLDIDANMPKLFIGDSLRLSQVITNLVSNAVKFTHKGEIKVSIKLQNQKEGRATLCVHVSDTGIGLTKEHIKSLFDSFSQADNSTTRKYGGSGLGLAITKEIVEMMNGTINVESKHGEGSDFYITVEMELQKESLDKKEEERYKQKLESSDLNRYFEKLSGAKVLVVEDNEQNVEVAKEFLKRANISVDVACNGEEALQKAQTQTYDGILMDCQMPVMDGYEATKKIREAGVAKTPIIAMSANVFEKDKQKCINSGMNDYVFKPIDVSKFYTTLAKWIEPSNRVPFVNTETTQTKTLLDAYTTTLDIKSALMRMDGDEKLLTKQFKGFIKSQEDFLEKIKKYIEDDDVKGAIRLAHTLKGLSGTIGATKLFEEAQELESDLKNYGFSTHLHSALDSIDFTIKGIIKDINSLLEQSSDTKEQKKKLLNKEELKENLESLEEMLNELDTQALDTIESIAPNLQESNLNQELQSINQYIEEFEFDEASKVLVTIKEKLALT